jgi:hypothetical protein
MIATMKIETYLEFKGLPVAKAAKELKITRGYLYEILKKTRRPGRKLALRIRDWSDGAVGFDDLWK